MNHADLPLVDKCLGDAVDDAAQVWRDRIGWVFDDEAVSFSTMKQRTDEVARALLAIGVGEGDVVATWVPNLPEFAYLEFACAKIGAVIAALNTRAKAFEVEHHLKHSDAVALFMVEKFLKHDFVATLAEVLGREIGPDASAGRGLRLETVVSLEPSPARGMLSWGDFIAEGNLVSPDELRARQRTRTTTQPTLMQYTSGTTSRPKGALIDHRYVLNAGRSLLHRLGVGEGDAFLNTQPFYHIGGSCAALPAPLTLGCRVVSAQYYQADRILALIERERCVARSGYGAMYIMEMDHPDFGKYDISSLKAGWCVGNPELMKRVQDRMHIPGLLQIYAATELGATSAWTDDSWDVRSRSCGTPLCGTEIKIVSPQSGETLGTGEVGEICMRGWWKMHSYLKQPDQTQKTLDTEGWAHSGDLGSLDAEGNLYFAGRLKDMLKIGGENVSAEEVEAILLSHPAIVQTAVVGMPDERLTEVVLAIVETRAGQTLEEAEVVLFCKERMANFRVPRHVVFVTEWPLTESGKIQKQKLRERYATQPVTA